MTVKDLLDQITFGSGDSTGEYRLAALRWLNLSRSEAASMTRWATAVDENASFDTTSNNTTGVYELAGYDAVLGDFLYDETNNEVIRHESYQLTHATDPDQSVNGPPIWWSHAGMTSTGVMQVSLKPIPLATYTIRYPGYRRLTDFGSADEGLEIDPYFGPISPWASAFAAGMRYYRDLDDNAEINAATSHASFIHLVRMRMRQNNLGYQTLRAQDVRAPGAVAMGRFDPAHYNNRGL